MNFITFEELGECIYTNISKVPMDVDLIVGDVYKRQGEQKKYSGAYKHQIQIITSQIFHFLDKKYHCGVPQWLSPAAPAQNRTVTPPEGDKLRRLEAYLSTKAEEKDATSIGILLSGC